jgi:pyruvate formate lyase activating enzyme
MERRPQHTDAERGLVFNIQKFSLHDGSGIRTLVFLKGCPLRCVWCSNPEGQFCAPQLVYDERKCIGTEACANACLQACQVDAIAARDDGKVEIDLDRCNACGQCVVVCPPRALELLGESLTVEEVLEVVEQDGAFYARSGGGLTLSGGEPLTQPAFAARLLEAAQARGIDTAVETSGYAHWSDLEKVCRHANQVFYDLKCMDSEKHREGTGVENARILENLRQLCEAFPELPVVVRTPVIPGFNDSPAAIQAIAAFVGALPRPVRYELLPYHRFGEAKYRELGREYPLPEAQPPSEAHMAALSRLAQDAKRASESGAL